MRPSSTPTIEFGELSISICWGHLLLGASAAGIERESHGSQHIIASFILAISVTQSNKLWCSAVMLVRISRCSGWLLAASANR